jgi:hypothetical protein
MCIRDSDYAIASAQQVAAEAARVQADDRGGAEGRDEAPDAGPAVPEIDLSCLDEQIADRRETADQAPTPEPVPEPGREQVHQF